MDNKPADKSYREAAPSSPGAVPNRDTDEINVLEYCYVLVKKKWLIILITIVGMVLGYVVALVKGPVFVAEVIIAPKEIESPRTPNISGLGPLGGLVASQLNMTGNASLDKIDLIVGSREFNATFIEKYGLLPAIYKYKWPRQYHKFFDTAQQTWKPDFIQPKSLEIGDMAQARFIKKNIDKNNTFMTISIVSKDSAFTCTWANRYITHLNNYIKSDIQEDAKENVDYLKKRLDSTDDPLLREKIQSLIANEIEKQMMVSKKAFKIVDPMYISKQFNEKRLFPLAFGFGSFFLSSLFIIFAHAFLFLEKSEEDRRLIDNLKYEVFRLPNRKKF